MKRFFKTLLLIILSFTALTVLIGAVIFFIYQNWEKEFESSMVKENVVVNNESISEDTVKKISLFTISPENTEFLSLTPQEFGYLLLSVFNEYLGQEIRVENIYIVPHVGNWDIYIQPRYKDISPWFLISLQKDTIQSPQIYITDLSIGPYSLNFLVERINDGITNALFTVNENGFSGRYLENIEFLEDAIVVKGSTY